MYLEKENMAEAAKFVNGPLWMDYKKALHDRKPAPPTPEETGETAAHRAFLRRGYEMAVEDIEKLCREIKPTDHSAIPDSLLDPRD